MPALLCRPSSHTRTGADVCGSNVCVCGTGIGKAIVEKLCSQGINVVLVALDDDMLKNTFAEMESKYPKLQFRKVSVCLPPAPPHPGACSHKRWLCPSCGSLLGAQKITPVLLRVLLDAHGVHRLARSGATLPRATT